MSSFRKRRVQKPMRGTRTSPQTGQVITSSGNPSLDVILGGGLPIGSICLIEEDKYVTHSQVLAKYFLAEGILSMQSCFLGSLDDDPLEILRKLPKPLTKTEVEMEKASEIENGIPENNGLRIAWRYNDLPIVNSEQSTVKIGHHFNLMEHMNSTMMNFAETVTWSDTEQDIIVEDEDEIKDPFTMDSDSTESEVNLTADATSTENCKQPEFKLENSADTNTNQEKQIFKNSKFQRILQSIQGYLNSTKYQLGKFGQKRLCRVCITSLGSPLWYDENFAKDILKFLTLLRATIRNSVSACLITMPMRLIANVDETLVPKMRNLVDYAIELESFAGSQKEMNPAFKEYSGLLHLHKITAINTLSAYMPETTDLAFKLRRKKFVIEQLHLPPELQETNNKTATKGADIIPKHGCDSTFMSDSKVSLDF